MSSENNMRIFESLDLPISPLIYSYPLTEQQKLLEYLLQLNEAEKKVYLIAFDHLQSSFNIVKSIGYIEWKKNNE